MSQEHATESAMARPPVTQVGAVRWLRENLFSGWLNTTLTLLTIYVLYVALPPLLDWVIFNAAISGTDRENCTYAGACWVFVKVRFWQFMYGFYPEPERWRVNVVFIIGILGVASLLTSRVPTKAKLIVGVCMLTIFPVFAVVMFGGGVFGLEYIETSQWGGLFLTLTVASAAMVGSFPLGMLLAIGRRSKLPVVKTFCVCFIEFFRGVPLITILFMASVMVPLFLPEGLTLDKLARAIIGITIFNSAYMAEVIRGGLQSIPKGQYEAAHALGLSYWQGMGLIILPQALKAVIPGLVNTFIGLFKDTTLIYIIGIFDLLGMVQASFRDTKWLGLAFEGYAFIMLVFWIFCYSMSKYSQYLERKLNTGHKS